MSEYKFEDPRFKDCEIEAKFHNFQATLGAIREIRSSRNIPLDHSIPFATGCDRTTADVLSTMSNSFGQMANAYLTAWGPDVEPPAISMTRVVQGLYGPITVYADVSQFIDVDAERKRLEKDRDNYGKQIASIEGKLNNKGFVDKAPAAVVQQQRDKLNELREQLAAVEAAIKKLGA